LLDRQVPSTTHSTYPISQTHRARRRGFSCCGRVGLLALVLFGGTAFAHNADAQASTGTATRKADLQIGGQFTFTPKSDYGTEMFYGGGGYLTFDFTHNFGVELNYHQVNGDRGIYERTYEVGGRYVRHFGIVAPYIRGSYGRGVFNFPDNVANLAYNMGAGALGADIRVQRHVNLRGDYEFQFWPSFPQNGLNPHLISIGAAYHF
jgi:hypothetical protein